MGPLSGIRVIEFAGLGPAPFAGMILADMGAEVLRIDRASAVTTGMSRGGALSLLAAGRLSESDAVRDLLGRGRRSVAVDLKRPEAAEVVLRLVESADALIEGFRPGVMERLGLGPEACVARNPRLVYGRMTGWGQEGPYAKMAGHDIGYIALAGALSMIGEEDGPPIPPLNLVADFGGGGMLLAFGIVCGVFEAARSGAGQVIDAAMVDGTALLTTMFHSLRAIGLWSDRRGANLLDGGAPFYRVYETSDGGYMAVGAIEPQFYAELLQILGLESEDLPPQMDRSRWREGRDRFEAVFRTRTREEWTNLFEGRDACVTPVLDIGEAMAHPHNVTRETFVEVAGVAQPAPAPRFSRTPGAIAGPPPRPGEHTVEALAAWGFPETEIDKLVEAGVVA